MNEDEALALIEARSKFGQRMGLDTMRGMLAELGDFHKSTRVLHVAGTNGKGSVCAMAAAALSSCGHRVGLYTSPHLVQFHERIRVNDDDISGADLAAATKACLPAIERFPEATYFEVATLVALKHFERARCDVVVLEVGLGGRLDATNVFERPLATVVTNISLEHTDVLGPTEAAIAREKGGVVKPGVPLVTGATGEALETIRGIAFERGAPLRILGDGFVAIPGGEADDGQTFEVDGLRDWGEVRIPFAGAHQAENGALALAALDQLDAAGVAVPIDAAKRGLATARWPGRLQSIGAHPRILLDGAHNPAGMASLATHLKARGLKPVVVFGALADKDWRAMVETLAPHVRDAICARVPSPRSAEPTDVARAFSHMGLFGMVVEDPGHALRTAEGIAGPDGVVLVTGSLYLVGDILARLG